MIDFSQGGALLLDKIIETGKDDFDAVLDVVAPNVRDAMKAVLSETAPHAEVVKKFGQSCGGF